MKQSLKLLAALATMLAVLAVVYRPADNRGELPNRVPEPAPYNVAEAEFFPPPFEEHWKGDNNPGQCESCHQQIFDEWNGSMMANSWRDPAWRAAFLLISRLTSTHGNCDIPEPPDGTERSLLNPFADGDGCSSTFDTDQGKFTLSRSGSLLDAFCSRCHMPTNYIDNIPLQNVTIDESGMEHGRFDPNFNPTSDNGTGIAFATLEEQFRNTESGKAGISCAVCHSMADTRETPFHNYVRSDNSYLAAPGEGDRRQIVGIDLADTFDPPQNDVRNLGFGIGAGAYRLSPRAIATPERLGPLSSVASHGKDEYLSEVFKQDVHHQQVALDYSTQHPAYRSMYFSRAEFCAACHDVTNPLPIKNEFGKWVGGFPIERTYTEWANSRYAERPGNSHFQPAFKRDCQTCHMQQQYGRPGTAQTEYDEDGNPLAPLKGAVASDAPEREIYSTHHFIGGNAYITRLIGSDVDDMGKVRPYPELSVYSYSSNDKNSVYNNAYWTNVDVDQPPTQHVRMAWDRLRNVLDLNLSGPSAVQPGEAAPLRVSVTNSGSGHNFPTGFPEGRNAWVAVRAFDLGSGQELLIRDSHWKRTSRGVGYMTDKDIYDPNFPKHCGWKVPAGSSDPFAYQFKAVASMDGECPTLDLPYATPLNLVVNDKGVPIDKEGRPLGRDNPRALPQFKDVDGDGDLFDDSFLVDWRLRPLPHADATLVLERYSVVVPEDVKGPIAVTAAVYYQSFEAMVAKKFLGNLADQDTDFLLEPCVLGGSCDGRVPSTEPAVVEGAPPVPMEVRNWVINVAGRQDEVRPELIAKYPSQGSDQVYDDVVVKAAFSEPVRNLSADDFQMTDSQGRRVPAFVDQISDGTWALFAHEIFLQKGEKYTVRIDGGVCDFGGNCTTKPVVWSFRTVEEGARGTGDTRALTGFTAAPPVSELDLPPHVLTVDWHQEGRVRVAFSEPVMNVTGLTLRVFRTSEGGDCSAPGEPVSGTLASNAAGDVWTFQPGGEQEGQAAYCVVVDDGVYDLDGRGIASPFRGKLASKASAEREVASR